MSTSDGLPGAHANAQRRAQQFLESEGVSRLLADIASTNESYQAIQAARDAAGVAPGEALIGPPAIPNEWKQMPTGQEVRVVDAKTGGAKGSKLARFDLIPQDVMWALAEHYGRGARKYEDRNWEKGFDWSLAISALQRHLSLFIQGVDVDDDPALYLTDDEERSLHIISVVWQAVALAAFALRGIGTDDRPKSSPAQTAPVETLAQSLDRTMHLEP